MITRYLLVLTLLSAAGVLPLAAEEPAPAAAVDAAPTAAPAAPPVASPADVVARVNGKEISRRDLDGAIAQAYRQMTRNGRSLPDETRTRLEWDVLQDMIDRQLVVQEAGADSVPDLEGKVQAQMEAVKGLLGGEAGFSKALQETAMNLEDYLAKVRDGIVVRERMQKLVQSQSRVTPEDVQKFYDANPGQFRRPETVRASHILLRLPADADEEKKAVVQAKMDAVRARLEKGESFATVAREVSEDPGSAPNGGDLGYFARGTMVPEFDAVAFSLAIDQVSEVVVTRFGLHLLRVTDRKPPHDLGFEEARADIERHLQSREAPEIIRNHLAELREAATLEVLIPVPPATPAVPGAATAPVSP